MAYIIKLQDNYFIDHRGRLIKVDESNGSIFLINGLEQLNRVHSTNDNSRKIIVFLKSEMDIYHTLLSLWYDNRHLLSFILLATQLALGITFNLFKHTAEEPIAFWVCMGLLVLHSIPYCIKKESL